MASAGKVPRGSRCKVTEGGGSPRVEAPDSYSLPNLAQSWRWNESPFRAPQARGFRPAT